MKANLLVELFTEELPPKALKRLGEAFAQAIADGLATRGLVADKPALVVYATPRRLGVKIPDVLDRAADRAQTKKLMPAKVAYDAAGAPTPALIKRLEKDGGSLTEIERKAEGNAEYVFLNQVVPGATLQAALQAALDNAIAKLPIPKVMSYQLADGATTVHFVRPAHGLVALHGADIVPLSALGLTAGRITHGHRFQGVKNISIANADAYEETLAAEGKVTASFAERSAEIERELKRQAAALGASLGPAADYAPLLEEVAALVERPTVYTGEFEREFLAVPAECLVLTMRQNQKYFPLFDGAGGLINKFLIVSNMRLADPKNIVEGNERVVRPRLADARFFFETDKKTRLEERVPQLAKVTYHNKLGNQLERVERIQLLAGRIARLLKADHVLAERAAWLAKADLLTGMVGEFPELQGIMGRYYALVDREDQRVADAIEQHYHPRFAGDSLPVESIAVSMALADKLETLAGLFGVGQQPTGDKDPFALRRHALGVIRLMIENKLAVSLRDLISAAFAVFGSGTIADASGDLETFVVERLRGYLRDAGYSANEIESVLSRELPARLDQIPLQLAAVRAFAALPEAASLAAANKRAGNILRKEGFTGVKLPDGALLKDDAEKLLANTVTTIRSTVDAHYDRKEYVDCLKTLAGLKGPVDSFFDKVMVNVEDVQVRNNRLALLSELCYLMNRVADISKLAA